jgi:gliding motility-associated-like protein
MKKLLLFSVLLFLSTFITAQTNFIKQDSVFAQSADCPPFACIDSFEYLNADFFAFTLDGQPFSPPNARPCDSTKNLTFFINLILGNNESGPWTLDSFRINGTNHSLNTFSTFQVLLDSLNVWDTGVAWTYGSAVYSAFSNLNKTYTDMYVTGGRNGTQFKVPFNSGTVFKGFTFRANPGFHQLIVRDTATNAKDTVTLRVACIQKDTIFKTINVSNNATYTVNTAQLLGTPQSASFINLCAKPTTHVNFAAPSYPNITYSGVSVGNDTACLKVCDQYGICDTTILIVTAQLVPSRKLTYRDSAAVGGILQSKCSILRPLGTINFFDEFNCGTTPQGHINHTIDKVGGCINFTAVSLGFDTVCIRVCNTLGVCDTSTYILKAVPVIVPDTPRTRIDDFVNTGTQKTNCSVVKPSGTGFTYVIESRSITSHVSFTLDASNGCVNFTGIAVGQDSIRVLTCNSTGQCTRTIFYVNAQVAVDTPRFPISNTVTIGTPKTVTNIQKPTGTGLTYLVESQSSTGHVGFTLDITTGAITFIGLSVGQDSVRILTCSGSSGLCVRTTFYINAVNPVAAPQGTRTVFIDSVTINTGAKSRNDIVKPTAPLNFFKIITQSTGKVIFNLDTVASVINFTGVALGTDSARIRVCNTAGTCDTTVYYITVKAPDTPRTVINKTVTIGTPLTSSDIVKPATGTIAPYAIESQSSTGHASFVLNNVAGTMTFTGLAVGTDSVRVLVCTTLGQCVRTVYYVNVIAPLDTPVTRLNKTVTIGTPLSSCDIKKPTIGTPAPYTIESQSTTGHVTATVDNVGGCINLTGLTVGQDSFRVLVCNTLGTSCVRTVYTVTAQAPVVVTQGNRTVFTDVVTIGAGAKTRTDIVKPTGTINSFKIIGQSTLGHVTFVLDTIAGTISFTGLTVGTDSARVIVCNTAGTCDTTTYFVTAQTTVTTLVGRKTTFQDSIIIGQAAKKRTDILIPTGTVATIKDVCAYSRTHVQFNIDQISNKVSFFGSSPAGVDSICIQVCNTAGLCDTTIYKVTSKSVITNYTPGSVTYLDSVAITGLPRQRCDLKLPPGNIISFDNISPVVTSPRVQFTIDAVTNCVIFKGLASGVGTGTFKVCNSLGQCDTTIYEIRSRATLTPKISGTFVIKDTITEGATRTRSDLEIPDGAINDFRNICQNNSGNEVFFAVDQTLKTITYRGVKAGFDTACIRVCNINLVCDTTIFIIETKPLLNVGGSRKHFLSDSLVVGIIRSKCDLMQPFNATTIRNICQTASVNKIRFDLNPATRCVVYTAVAVGVDTACIEICDASGVCDTTYFYFKALKDPTLRPTPSEERFTIKINERIKFCPDTTELSGSPINLIKFCEVTNYDNVDITLLGNDAKKCVLIDGKSAGKDTFCIAIQNQGGFTDTTRIYITVLADTFRPKIGYDSVSLKIGELGVICPDSSELFLAVVTDLKNCTNTTVDNASMIFNSVKKCVELRGLSAGRDTMCVVLCNAKNVCDTTIIYVKVSADTVKPISSTEIITVKLGETLTFNKVDSTQIFGAVDTTYDACPAKHGTFAQLTLDRIAKTVTIQGRKPGGPDTMCIVVYNKLSNLRDTTFLVVTVKDTVTISPITIQANNDIIDSVKLGTKTPILVYANDSLYGKKPISLTIVSQPKKGKVDTVSFRDGLLNYEVTRSPYNCGIDTFRYRVCVLNGTDTVCSEANVTVTVVCSEIIKVANGFSPNGDRDNEFFFIDGLGAYPDNTVLVYNRWGNEVLKAKNYNNDWHGDWKGKDLPDGTYFYLIRDDAKGEVLQTGWVVINR